jgi:hypothetical protein
MQGRVWQALIADLKASRKIPARERAAADRAVQRAMTRTLRGYGGHFRLAPQRLRGDELQAVLRPGAPVLSILTYLRAQLAAGGAPSLALRAGIGSGALQRISSKGPFASDGEAFHRARAALEAADRGGGARLTAWRTGDAFFDRVSDSMLALIDAFAVRWTAPQWEAIAGRLESKALQTIAREKGVGFQSVSKRLRAASWSEVHQAIALLEELAAVAGDGSGAAGVAAERRRAPSPSKG